MRAGSSVSSAAYVTMCHPPKANNPAPTALTNPPIDIAPSGSGARADEAPANRMASSTPIAAIFTAVSAVCTVVPRRTPT